MEGGTTNIAVPEDHLVCMYKCSIDAYTMVVCPPESPFYAPLNHPSIATHDRFRVHRTGQGHRTQTDAMVVNSYVVGANVCWFWF